MHVRMLVCKRIYYNNTFAYLGCRCAKSLRSERQDPVRTPGHREASGPAWRPAARLGCESL